MKSYAPCTPHWLNRTRSAFKRRNSAHTVLLHTPSGTIGNLQAHCKDMGMDLVEISFMVRTEYGYIPSVWLTLTDMEHQPTECHKAIVWMIHYMVQFILEGDRTFTLHESPEFHRRHRLNTNSRRSGRCPSRTTKICALQTAPRIPQGTSDVWLRGAPLYPSHICNAT